MHYFLKFIFGLELYMFCVHHQESSTVYTAIGTCHTGYADCLLEVSITWLKVRSKWAQMWKGENEIQRPITLIAVKKEPYDTVHKTYRSEWGSGKTTDVMQEFLWQNIINDMWAEKVA
jgi:hypothetical protein